MLLSAVITKILPLQFRNFSLYSVKYFFLHTTFKPCLLHTWLILNLYSYLCLFEKNKNKILTGKWFGYKKLLEGRKYTRPFPQPCNILKFMPYCCSQTNYDRLSILISWTTTHHAVTKNIIFILIANKLKVINYHKISFKLEWLLSISS